MRFIPAVSLVRIQLQPPAAPWSRGLRHRPFTAVTRVRISSGSPWKKQLHFAIAFFSYIRLTASGIAAQWYSAFCRVIFASRVSARSEYHCEQSEQYHFCGRQKYHAEHSSAYHYLFGEYYGIITLCRRRKATETHTAFENRRFSHKNIERLKKNLQSKLSTFWRHSSTDDCRFFFLFSFFFSLFSPIAASEEKTDESMATHKTSLHLSVLPTNAGLRFILKL